MEDLKRRTIRGGLAKLCGQAAGFALRIGYLVIMARLLDPKDFGLVAMVTAVTGLYGLLTSAGLSTATVQKADISIEQISTLFWINILIGIALAGLCMLTAPVLVRFYGEPRLLWVTATIAVGFILNAAGVQHSAVLQRDLRYVSLTVIELLSQAASSIVGIGMALAGFGYWALVAAAIAAPATFVICAWSVTQWTPGLPRRDAEIGSILRFGGTVTLNGVIVYIAYNLDKVLLGRFWGADALGLYGRAYQLINIPTDNLNAAVGGVTFAALSRLQDDPDRFRTYFLNGYSLVNALTIPITVFCGLFADDVVLVLLGPKWTDSVPIFRLLAPTVMIFGIINPLAWLMISIGLYGRSLRIALVLSPLVVAAYAMGLPYGPEGVAFAFSAAMTLWLVPHVLWCIYGTVISPRDLVVAIAKPLLSALVAGALAYGARYYVGGWEPPFLRLIVEGGIMFTVFFFILLFVMGVNTLFLDLLRGLFSKIDARM